MLELVYHLQLLSCVMIIVTQLQSTTYPTTELNLYYTLQFQSYLSAVVLLL